MSWSTAVSSLSRRVAVAAGLYADLEALVQAEIIVAGPLVKHVAFGTEHFQAV